MSADRERVIQIIANLADNAFSYTEAGGTITLEAYLEDGGMVVSVGDTGIGLSPEDKARMFERFYRAENPLVMASAGTGLGLSIVQAFSRHARRQVVGGERRHWVWFDVLRAVKISRRDFRSLGASEV